jgi:hypothetical protein
MRPGIRRNSLKEQGRGELREKRMQFQATSEAEKHFPLTVLFQLLPFSTADSTSNPARLRHDFSATPSLLKHDHNSNQDRNKRTR